MDTIDIVQVYTNIQYQVNSNFLIFKVFYKKELFFMKFWNIWIKNKKKEIVLRNYKIHYTKKIL